MKSRPWKKMMENCLRRSDTFSYGNSKSLVGRNWWTMRGKLSIPEPRTWFPAELNSTKPFPSPLSLSLRDQRISLSLYNEEFYTFVWNGWQAANSVIFSFCQLLKKLGKWKLLPSLWLVPKFQRLWLSAYTSAAYFGLYQSLWTETMVQARSFHPSMALLGKIKATLMSNMGAQSSSRLGHCDPTNI